MYLVSSNSSQGRRDGVVFGEVEYLAKRAENPRFLHVDLIGIEIGRFRHERSQR